MKTIAILFILAVVGGAAPAASVGRDHLTAAVMVFAAALALLIAACVVSGWILFERRTLTRMASWHPVIAARPVERPALPQTVAVEVSRQTWLPGRIQLSGAHTAPRFAAPISGGSSDDAADERERVAFAGLALSPSPAERATSSARSS